MKPERIQVNYLGQSSITVSLRSGRGAKFKANQSRLLPVRDVLDLTHQHPGLFEAEGLLAEESEETPPAAPAKTAKKGKKS